MSKPYFYRFKYRTVFCLVSVCLGMLFCIVRLYEINYNTLAVNLNENTVTVDLETARGDIVDCKGRNITGAKHRYAVVFLPCNEAKRSFNKIANKEEKDIGLKKLENNYPAVLIRDKAVTDCGIYSFEISNRYGDICSLEHIIGYINSEKTGVYGLEKAYNSLLESNIQRTASFATDAEGNFLPGAKPSIKEPDRKNKLFITIDRQIQKIAANAANSIQKGAVVVSEINSGKIRAMVSRPGFYANSIDESLKSSNSPLLNRALLCFGVGSVFKPLIGAALAENKKSDFKCFCGGKEHIVDFDFHCHKLNGHGELNMTQALAQSCNIYFYNAAKNVSADSLISTAKALQFCNRIYLANGIYARPGNLPSTAGLKSPAALANFSIGQGEVTLSPLAITNLYSAIANNGVYYDATLIEGTFEDNEFKPREAPQKNIPFSAAAAQVLKQGLIECVRSGTGKTAAPANVSAAGKTATAQTGRYKDKKEVVNAWFCGFFPVEGPKYTVTVFVEDAATGGSDCAPIFKEIAEKITEAGL